MEDPVTGQQGKIDSVRAETSVGAARNTTAARVRFKISGQGTGNKGSRIGQLQRKSGAAASAPHRSPTAQVGFQISRQRTGSNGSEIGLVPESYHDSIHQSKHLRCAALRNLGGCSEQRFENPGQTDPRSERDQRSVDGGRCKSRRRTSCLSDGRKWWAKRHAGRIGCGFVGWRLGQNRCMPIICVIAASWHSAKIHNWSFIVIGIGVVDLTVELLVGWDQTAVKILANGGCFCSPAA